MSEPGLSLDHLRLYKNDTESDGFRAWVIYIIKMVNVCINMNGKMLHVVRVKTTTHHE